MIKNIIFDLGNVLINFKPRDLLAHYTNNVEELNRFVSKIFLGPTWLKLDHGTLPFSQAREVFLKEFPHDAKLINIFFDRWKEVLTPIQRHVDVLKKLKSNGYNIFVLSNFIDDPFSYVKEQYDFFKILDGLVISYQEHFIKPEKEIYEILIKRYNLNPQECVFLDDYKEFLEPAKIMGMSIILVENNTDINKKLRELKVNI